MPHFCEGRRKKNTEATLLQQNVTCLFFIVLHLDLRSIASWKVLVGNHVGFGRSRWISLAESAYPTSPKSFALLPALAKKRVRVMPESYVEDTLIIYYISELLSRSGA